MLFRIFYASLHNFNPRTREGCDPDFFPGMENIPTDFNPRTREGCDSVPRACPFAALQYFNPRTREGCDDRLSGNQSDIHRFQSTHP